MWLIGKILKIVYPSKPRIEYVDVRHDIFDKHKTAFDYEHWTLSNKEFYFYTGKQYKKIEAVIYELDTSINFDEEPVATPPGIVVHPSNICIKYPGNIYLKTSQKLKIIL